MTDLYWLPKPFDWNGEIRALQNRNDDRLAQSIALAKYQLSFIQTNTLDRVTMQLGALKDAPRDMSISLALLGSATMDHLHAAIRVAGMRRGLSIEIYQGGYGQYWQEITDRHSALYRNSRDIVVLALDADHLSAPLDAQWSEAAVKELLDDTLSRLHSCWTQLRKYLQCQIIIQLPLNTQVDLLGSNEHRLPGSKRWFIDQLCFKIKSACADSEVDLLSLERSVGTHGLSSWHNPSLWYHARQEIAPNAAPLYGELLCRLIGAQRGVSKKCVILDLDNTLWGGEVGEVGIEGLQLGTGSAAGEAFAEFQGYLLELSRRGIVLAVCSKNDMSVAEMAFEQHPDMVLKRANIALFAASWTDKPTVIRGIAQQLGLSLDALVFVDDSPFERDFVRRELPSVEVLELPDDPALFRHALSDSGCFESIHITEDDRVRSSSYRSIQEREGQRLKARSLESYLDALDMKLYCRRISEIDLPRVVQLIGKTNQFNLTTRRYNREQVTTLMEDKNIIPIQLRLNDRYGNSGVIAIVIGRRLRSSTLVLDTWLMSCRVLGRGIEKATLDFLVDIARKDGISTLIGEYIPSGRNNLVENHYIALGFHKTSASSEERNIFELEIRDYEPQATSILLVEDRG